MAQAPTCPPAPALPHQVPQMLRKLMSPVCIMSFFFPRFGFEHFYWFEQKYCPAKRQKALSLEMHPPVFLANLTHLIWCEIALEERLRSCFHFKFPRVTNFPTEICQRVPKHFIRPDHILGNDSNQTSVQAAWPNYWFVLIFLPTSRWRICSSWERGRWFFSPPFFLRLHAAWNTI